ncbi:MAG: hypothetical protein IPL20_03245 [Saprospiraceae bacterium]|nr:hypothetical protein [Saprospiraceae bacterium]
MLTRDKKSTKDVKYDIKEYHVVFLDLLIKHKNHNWSHINGLDIYAYINNANPFCVVPIITSMPRGPVVSLMKEITGLEISADLVFSKSDAPGILKAQIQERMSGIISTCKTMLHNQEKLENRLRMPKTGSFSTENRLYLHQFIWSNKRDIEMAMEFNKFVDKAFQRVGIIRDPLAEHGIISNDWDGKLKKDMSKFATFFGEGLEQILTYRLAILDFCGRLAEYKKEINGFLINPNEIGQDIKQFLSKIGAYEKLDKGLLVTKLGFNISKTKNEDDITILTINLFPHEHQYLADHYFNDTSSDSSITDDMDRPSKNWVATFNDDSDCMEILQF